MNTYDSYDEQASNPILTNRQTALLAAAVVGGSHNPSMILLNAKEFLRFLEAES